MSAPKTNIDRQVSRHRGPLVGMISVLVFVGLLVLGWNFYTSNYRDSTQVVPEGTETQAPATADPATGDSDPAAPATETPTTPVPPASSQP